jgi:hypothetical protein
MTSSKLAIYGAIAANVCIAATKLLVASTTGSSVMLCEGISFTIALRQFPKQAGAAPFREAIHRSKDPTT